MPTNHKYNLLIATDDEVIAPILQSELINYNYSVVIKRSFKELIDEAQNQKYDLVILTSLGLIATEIPDCVTQLKIINPNSKIMVMSNYGSDDFDTFLAENNITAIHKFPIDIELLHSDIHSLLKT